MGHRKKLGRRLFSAEKTGKSTQICFKGGTSEKKFSEGKREKKR